MKKTTIAKIIEYVRTKKQGFPLAEVEGGVVAEAGRDLKILGGDGNWYLYLYKNCHSVGSDIPRGCGIFYRGDDLIEKRKIE